MKFEVRLSAEQKVDLLICLFEEKYNAKIDKRIMLSGYLDEPEYKLVLDFEYKEFKNDVPISIFGKSTKNILEVYSKFLEQYWEDREKMKRIEAEGLENDRKIYLSYLKDETICMSESELLLKAQIKGYIS